MVGECTRVEYDIGVGRVGRDRNVRFARVQVDSLSADEHQRCAMRAERFEGVEQYLSRL